MKNRKYSIAAFLAAFSYWFVDSLIHFLFYDESRFELVPNDWNEFWMRSVIVILLILFGMYADNSTRKLLVKEKQLEAARIYDSMIYATHHILNNLLNEMQLFRIEAMRCKDFDPEVIKLYDNSINEAKALVQRLSAVENITSDNIWASVDPRKVEYPSRHDKADV